MLEKVKLISICSAISLLIVFISIKSPDVHVSYLRNRVGSSVGMALLPSFAGGGTAFQVKAPSGKTYLITNKHVCQGSKYLVIAVEKEQALAKILFRSEEHDICALSPVNILNTLDLGDDPEIGDKIAIVGHPLLTPLQVSVGIINGYQPLLAIPFLELLELPPMIPVYWTSAPTYPGNSGSPVVDFFGNVVGILFAGMQDHVNMIVPVSSLKEFLKDK